MSTRRLSSRMSNAIGPYTIPRTVHPRNFVLSTVQLFATVVP